MRVDSGQGSIRDMSDVKYNLEKPAADVVAYLSQGPALYELPLGEVRKAVDGAQAGVRRPTSTRPGSPCLRTSAT